MRSINPWRKKMSKLVLMALLSVSCVTFAADKKAAKKEEARKPNQVGETYSCTAAVNGVAADKQASECKGKSLVTSKHESLACCPAGADATDSDAKFNCASVTNASMAERAVVRCKGVAAVDSSRNDMACCPKGTEIDLGGGGR
jgi:hypothetical protein